MNQIYSVLLITVIISITSTAQVPDSSYLLRSGNGQAKPEYQSNYDYLARGNQERAQKELKDFIAGVDRTELTDEAQAAIAQLEANAKETDPKVHQVPRFYNLDEGLDTSRAQSIFISFEIKEKCSGRVASSRFLPTEIPKDFPWFTLPSEKPSSDSLVEYSKLLPAGSLPADYNAVESNNNSPNLFMVSAEMPSGPQGYMFTDPRYIHVHDPDKAPSTREESLNHENIGGEKNHKHVTDAFYIADEGTVDLWVPMGTRHLLLFCDGNATDPLRIPIPAPENSPKRQQARHMAAQDTNSSDAEYREIRVVGPPDRVLNIVFVAGAFLEAGRETFFKNVTDLADMLLDVEMDNLYNADVDDAIHDMHASVPHNRYLHFWNIFAVFQASADNGPSRPAIGYTNNNNLRCIHPADIERGLSCNWDLARALAAVAPVNMYGKPGRTLVITLVNSAVYGGTGQHIFGSRNFGNFFNGYDLTDISQKRRMLSLMDHEIGHAFGGVADEYIASPNDNGENRYYTNCQMGSGGNAPSTPRWKWWIDQLKANPSGFFAAFSDRVRSSDWTILSTPSATCLYNNYYKPSDYCMMNRLNNYAMCPVCREAVSVTEMRYGFDLQFPRKPLEDQVTVVLTNTTDPSILNVNSNFTLHFSRILTTANHFKVTLTDYDGENIPLLTGVNANLCPVCFTLQARNFAKYPVGQIVELVANITDNTLFVSDPIAKAKVTADQPNQFTQTTKFRILVTSRSPSTFVYADTNAHSFAAQDTVVVNATLVKGSFDSEVGKSESDLINYYAMCSPEDGAEGLCSLNLTNNVYNSPTNIDGALSQYDLWAVALVVVLAVLYLVGWIFQCIRNRDRERGIVRPIFKVEFNLIIQIIRILMMATAVCLMIAAIATLALGAYYYTKLSVLGKLLIFVGVGVSVPLYLLAFIGYSSVVSRSKRMLMINGILLFVALAGTATLFGLTKSFIDGMADDASSTNDWFTEKWNDMVVDDPSQICSIQNELQCTGWNQSCLATFGVSDGCPGNCEVINNKYPTACRALVRDFISTYGPTVLYVVGVGVGMLVIGIGFDLITWIALWSMKRSIRNKNKRQIKATGSRSSINAADQRKYGALLLLMSLSSDSTAKLKQEFRRIDKDKSGTLDKLEMLLFFKKALCYKPTEAEINEIFAIADTDNDKTINMNEFISLFAAGNVSSRNDKQTQIVRSRLMERGLLRQVEMAQMDAKNKNDFSTLEVPTKPKSPKRSPKNSNEQPMLQESMNDMASFL